MRTQSTISSRPRTGALAALPLVAAATFAVPASAQVGLGMSPMRLELRISPGAQHSDALSITNDSSDKIRVHADLLDFYIDGSETPQFQTLAPGEAEYSCRSWLTLNPMEMELGPGERALVRYTIRVPREASSRSYHCAAGFRTLPTATQTASSGLRTAVRIVAAFYAIVGNPGIEGEITEMTLRKVPGSTTDNWRAVVVMENYGYMHFRPAGALDIIDESGRLIQSAAFNPIPVLPKRRQQFQFPVQLPEGSYTLKARIDLGAHELIEATAAVVARAPAR